MLCKICRKVFQTQGDFLRHCRDDHRTESGIPRITCNFDDVCQRQFSNADSFRHHLRNHRVIQPQLSECSDSRQQTTVQASRSFFESTRKQEESSGPHNNDDATNFLTEPRIEEEASHKSIDDEPLGQIGGCDRSDPIIDYNILDCVSNLLSYFRPLRLGEPVDKDLTTYLKDFEEDLFVKMVHLLADDTLPRNKALQTMKDMQVTYGRILQGLLLHQRSKNIGDSQSFNLIETIANPKVILSEHRIIEKIKTLKLDVAYTTPILDSKRSSPASKIALHVLKVFDVCDLFTKLFSVSKFFNEVVEYIDTLDNDSDWIYNVVQSRYWKSITSRLHLEDNELALPVYIYNDDFEPLNALGSHRGAYKLSGVYIYMPCLPPHLQSKLEYIFLAMLFFATDRSTYGNGRVFTPLIDQLNKLQNGIKVNHQRYATVKLIPIVLLGDNLGLNTLMGFVQCFVANFYCRICKLNKAQMATAVSEDATKLRTKENYNEDLHINNHSLTGITQNSVWNNLNNFHVTNNLCVDIMHDLFEGACHVILSEILNSFIYQHKYFTLAEFNKRLKRHKFGPMMKNTNIALITDEGIKNRKLITSASEMLVLFTNFGFIIGNFVPEDAPEWSVYLIMREIISIVLQKKVHKNTHYLLRDLIVEHHTLFKEIFKKDLTPKLHFMVHYPNVMKEIGPISGISSMRFESFHRIFKNTIKVINCRKNLLESCVFKIRMRCASMFLNLQSTTISMLPGKKTKVSKELLNKYDCDFLQNEFVFTTKFVQTSYNKVKVGYVCRIENKIDDSPVFALINEIIIDDDNFYFGYQQLTNIGFYKHYNAYKVVVDDVYFIRPANFNCKFSYIYQGVKNVQLVSWD